MVYEQYHLQLPEDEELTVEHIDNPDWDGLSDSCPECDAEEFNHIKYRGGRYGQYQGAVVERTDYWYQKGSLYSECLGCGEVLFKNPAYDILKAYLEGEFG